MEAVAERGETITIAPARQLREEGKKKSAVVIVSGGLDSTVLLHYVVKRLNYLYDTVTPVAFFYNQRHSREIDLAIYQTDQLDLRLAVVDIPWMQQLKSSALTNPSVRVPEIKEILGDPQPVTYVPFRNLLFLTIACQFAEDRGAQSVFYGAQRHDLYGYWDATSEFVERVNALLLLNRQHRIEIVTPLVFNSKGQNISLGAELGVDFTKTYSCYEGGTLHCGRCATCAERKKGFVDAKIEDPTAYMS